MTFDEKDEVYTINGYEIKVHLNPEGDTVIKQHNYHTDESVIIVGKEQVQAFLEALHRLQAI